MRLATTLLVCLLPVLAWADLPGGPPSALEEYASPEGHFRLQVRSFESESPPLTEQSSTPGGGTLEVTTRRESSYKTGDSREIITTREKDARKQLVAVKLEVRSLPSRGSELRLVDTKAGQNAPPLWHQTLDYTPRSALVSPSGQYVATFDHFYNTGDNPDVVVLYGPGGKRVCRLALEDFLSWFERNRLPRSMSNTHWAGHGTPGHRFDEARGVLILKVSASNRPPIYEQEYVEKRISLSTGEVLP